MLSDMKHPTASLRLAVKILCLPRDMRVIFTDRITQLQIALRRTMRKTALALAQTRLADLIIENSPTTLPKRAVHFRGRAMEVRHRNKDHVPYWHDASLKFPQTAEFLRKTAHSALRSGNVSRSEWAFQELVDTGLASADDTRFVIGLSLIDQARGSETALRRRVRWFLRGLRNKPDYRIAAVRLSRLIFAFFPRKKPVIPARTFPKMLARAGACPQPREFLQRAYTCEQMLLTESPASLLETDVSSAQCRQFIALVRGKLIAQEPFSFVRVGDGEAACIPYEPRLAPLARGDSRDRERIWWGHALPAALHDTLMKNVSRAIWHADSIGLPTISRILRELNLTRNEALEYGLTGRGLRAILYAAERYRDFRPSHLPPPLFTSCHLHQDIQHWKLYEELLGGAGEVVLVSCHPSLADWIAPKYGVKVIGNIVLPPDKVSAPKLVNSSATHLSLPYMMDEILSQIDKMPPGRLVLVGGGYPGKWLVDAAKKRGGIALDVGSIFDYWLGFPTRSYLDLSPV